MAETLDLSTLSPDEVECLLAGSGKPLLVLTPWERIEFIQSRVKTDEKLVAEYQEALSAGDKLPPSKGIFIQNSGAFKIYDGIHTAMARHNLGVDLIPVFLRLGTTTDAEIAAAGANFTNGARRTNADKRHAVAILVRNPETGCRSNNWLARIARVSPDLVEDVRIEVENDPVNPVPRPKKRRVARNGVEYDIAAPAEPAVSATKTMTSEKLVERIIGFLAKHLDARSAEERTDICRQVVVAVREKFSLS